ncbi:MAG TPA: hypothetical protein VN364_13775 [Bellilinea sp.]|nr:hypothetical protein [Bellilinea sp.]
MTITNTKSARPISSSESLNILMLVLMVLLVFLMATRVPADPDMWWHLRAGEETVTNGKVYLTDNMTFTRNGEPWVNHSWLSEVVLFLAFKAGGYTGLTLFVAILACATMLVLYRSMRGGIFQRALITVLACATLAPIWAPRPQQFSLLFFAILNHWLMQYMSGKNLKLWSLPLLFILWSNLHGGYSFGFLLLGITLGGMILDRLFRPGLNPAIDWPRIGKLADWTAISLVAVLINPNGLNTWKIPFQTIGVQFNQYIQEWQSLDFHAIYSLPYVILLFGCLIAIGLSERRATGVELAGLTFFGVSSLNAQRLIGIFSLFAATVLSNHTAAIVPSIRKNLKATPSGRQFSQWRERSDQHSVATGLRRAINLTLVVLVALAGVIKLIYVSHPIIVDSSVKTYYPVGAVDYLSDNGKPGNVLNDYGWGGYLDWRLRENKIFIDGRADFFPQELFDEWIALIGGKPGWQASIAKYDIQYILLPPEMPVVDLAVESGWVELYHDEISVLLEQP